MKKQNRFPIKKMPKLGDRDRAKKQKKVTIETKRKVNFDKKIEKSKEKFIQILSLPKRQ